MISLTDDFASMSAEPEVPEAQSSLIDLPTEILESIFFNLPIPTVCGEVSRTCRRLYSVSRTPHFWSTYLKKCMGYEPTSLRLADVEPLKRAFAFGKEEKRWKTDRGLERWRSAQFHGSTVDALKLHETKNGVRLAVSGSRDRSLILWDVGNVAMEDDPSVWHKTVPGAHTGWIWSVGFSSDDKSVFSCAFDSMVTHWEIAEGGGLRKVNTTNIRTVPMNCLTEGDLLYVSSYDGRILMFDTRQGLNTPMILQLPQRQPINSLAIMPNSDHLFALASENGRLYCIDKRRMEVVRRRSGFNSCLYMQVDSNLLATSGKEGVVHYLDPQTLRTEYKWQLPEKSKDVKVNPIFVSPGALIYAKSYQLQIYTPGRRPQVLAQLETTDMIISVDYKNGDLTCGFTEGIVKFWPRENRTMSIIDSNEL